MTDDKRIFAHRDDDPKLTGEDLADKVMRAIRYIALVESGDLAVSAVGRVVIIDGHVACEADIACAGDAAACVIGVGSVLNQLEVRAA